MDILTSSCKPKLSQPQLLSPKFFEQPPKLLPPSIFRQTVASRPPAQGKSCARQPAREEESCVGDPAKKKESKPTEKQNESIAKVKELPVDHSVTKKIKLSSSDSLQDVDATFNPKYDNQLRLVEEKVSYTQAVKQRWKDSEILGRASTEMVREDKNLKKVLEYTTADLRGNSTTAKGQDTPTLSSVKTESGSRAPATERTSYKTKIETSHNCTDSRRVVRPSVKAPVRERNVSREFGLATANSTSFDATSNNPALKNRNLSPRRTHKSLASSPPVSSVAVVTEIPPRNNFDKVEDFANKPQTTDNLKPRHEKTSLTTKVATCNQRLKPKSGSRDHRHPSPLVNHKTKASPPTVGVRSHTYNSATTVTPTETTMAVAMDTDSDLALADVLQSEEYSRDSRLSSEYRVKRKEVQTKPKIDCSSDFEIARRLQQDIDAEIAYSMQNQEQHHNHRPKQDMGHRLGGDEVQGRTVHEEVEGYYDNNNQHKYRIREHCSAYHGATVGSGVRGTSSSMRRPVSHQQYSSGATATVEAFPTEEVDMSYETLVELEDVSRGLDKATISRLSNTYMYHSSGSAVKSCSVCLNEFEDGQVLRSLPCIHAFHETCIDKWLTNNRHCPVCMKDIDTM